MLFFFKVVSLWVTVWSCKLFMTAGEVTLVNRNVTDSFRVGKDGCRNDTDCPDSATCQVDSGLCLCSDSRPNFLNYTAMSGAVYECVTSRFIQAGLGELGNCSLGYFQLTPYSPNDSDTKFTDQQDLSKLLKSCSLQRAQVKFPDNVTFKELQWLDEPYADLVALNKTLCFKWKRSVLGLQGTILTLNLHCLTESGSYNPCLRAKVLGTWQPDDPSVTITPLVTTTKMCSLPVTPKATSTVQMTTVRMTTVTTEKPKSTANTNSNEHILDSKLLNIILMAILFVSFIVNIILITCTRKLLRKTRRMRDENLKMKEMPNTDQQRKSRRGDDIEAYDEVVSRSGMRNDGYHNEPFPSSTNDKNKGRLSEHNYDEPISYEPLRRNPLQDQGDYHKYQSLMK